MRLGEEILDTHDISAEISAEEKQGSKTANGIDGRAERALDAIFSSQTASHEDINIDARFFWAPAHNALEDVVAKVCAFP